MDPSIMFGDEPTSGLDAFMAESVVRQLAALAQGGRCVITTIHQPSTDVYGLFSKVRESERLRPFWAASEPECGVRILMHCLLCCGTRSCC